ncbi:MAG: hypothetical protein KDC92_03550, partial [Bacteroidetes bacterium]|nr:hypothetical protein [Bacteroidota bacterium]
MRLFGYIFLALAFTGCMSYHAIQGKFNRYFESGDYQKAEQLLSKEKKADERRNRLLYFFNRGLLSFLQNKHEESNAFFEKAVLFYENESQKLGTEILTNFTNPNISPYFGESFEHMYVNYYKALNYLMLNDYDAALVECRRLTQKLNAINDIYEGRNKFKNSAYLQWFVGMVYETVKDHNNAFVAYRNSYNLYNGDYQEFFALGAPEQLKTDLLRAAGKSGLATEFDYYEKAFGSKYVPAKSEKATAIVLWHNGLAPVKEEWSIAFTANQSNGNLYFVNAQYGFSIPVPPDQAQNKHVQDIRMLKVAMPKYFSRIPAIKTARVFAGNSSVNFQVAEDIGQIAERSLQDRIAKEIGKAVLRAVVKKASEIAAREQNGDLGTVLGAVNFFT